jgi:hypothetical protein
MTGTPVDGNYDGFKVGISADRQARELLCGVLSNTLFSFKFRTPFIYWQLRGNLGNQLAEKKERRREIMDKTD